jgi:hypothetical protein
LPFIRGWYGERQTVQVWFIIGVAVICALIAITLLFLARSAPAPTWLGLFGTTTVLAFVLIRAALWCRSGMVLAASRDVCAENS